MLCKQSVSPKTFGSFTQKNFNFSPPPPPDGRPDRWDLQFCRFWGWNWVLRSEGNEDKVEQLAMTNALKRKKSRGRHKAKRNNSAEDIVGSGPLQPLPTKQQLRELCKCIFKPQRKYLPSCVKDGFQTPSQNTVQWKTKCCAKKESKIDKRNRYKDRVSSHSFDGRQCVQQECGLAKSFTVEQLTASADDTEQPKARLTNSRNANQPIENIRQYTADKEVSCRRSCTDDTGSTTDGSVEYVSLRIMNGQCCSCCHDHRKLKSTNQQGTDSRPPVSKYSLEVQTSQSQQLKRPSLDCKFTQTPCVNCKTVEVSTKNTEDKLIKVSRKKVICLCVCCCPCSRQNGKSLTIQKSDDDDRCSTCQRRRIDPNEQLVPEKQTSFTVNKTNNDLPEKEMPVEESEKEPSKIYNTVIPPPSTKAFSKFGTPSKSYSWMKAIGSDKTDSNTSQYQFYKSPLTGKTYDLSSVNIDDQFKLTLPDAIDVSDDLVYLKQLDKSWKSDKESRLVLDAVCDAIISEHEDNIRKEQVNDILFKDMAPNSLKDWTKAGYEVKKLNNIFDEIFNLVPPSDDEHIENALFTATAQSYHQSKPDASVSSIKKHQKIGRKRSLNQSTDENVGKKLKSDDKITTTNTNEVTESGSKVDDIFGKTGTIVKESDKTIENMQTPLKPLSQTSLLRPQSIKSFQAHPKKYPMSSDIIKNDLTLFQPKLNEQESKKSYEIFCSDRKSYMAPEEATVLSENHKEPDDLDNIISEELLKINRLSVQSFLVCDTKSSETRTIENEVSIERKRSSKKRKSKSSLIPVRRRKH
ncbi:hypothetical protein GWI33_006480 [Rhynchophorus ferrugineus]|uniref:Uncharacterized protein n=1 Tax=Rhynchophorus ferrugineus TaxID=354439 RepID=A0A834MHB7_RHYFE|nr:hypothetical protein GWI33_006480 [Rhynchophorus ferrugineus]